MVTRIIACFLMGASIALAGVRPAAALAPDSIKFGLDATYDASATITWRTGKMTVTSTALVTNNSVAAVSALTFNAAPAKIGRMQLLGARIGSDPALAEVQDQSIVVTLAGPLEPTQQVSVTIDYVATFGGSSGNKQWLFAKVKGIATAYRWIPWLSRAYPFFTPTYGEPFVTKVSSEVRVSITTDQPMLIATSGQQTGGEGLTKTFVAHNVRDFNFAASPNYATRTATWGSVSISFFYVQLPVDRIQQLTLASMDRFSQRVGAYPYPTLSVAEVPTGPSMESPAMIWLTQKAIARGTVTYLTVHEMAHQWFYGVVGNDQAKEPFADEAMAEFLTRDFIGHRSSRCAVSILDMRVFDYSSACYYEVIYVQGDNYLDAYRFRVGDAAFWDGIRRYYEEYKFRLGGTRQLLETLDEAAGPLGGGHSGRFPSLYPGVGG
jgi:hypothetical protein